MTIEQLKEKFADPKFYFGKAYDLACEAHKEDKRKDGKPYMTHVDAVILESFRISEYYTSIFSVDEILTIAALHDVYEDHREKYSLTIIAERLGLKKGLKRSNISTGIDAISKKPKGEQEYSDYVRGVKNHRWAKIVKIADLTHNMSDLAPGNLRDKYDLTLAFLEDSLH